MKEFEINNGILEKYNGSGGNVVIPDGVQIINTDAFHGCDGLKNVTIPNSVKSIGLTAFYLCRNLQSITIPGSITCIPYLAFGFCNELTSVTISDGVTSIDDNAFDYCEKLQSITIPGSVTSIGNYAFRGCRGLKSIAIPIGVTNIGDFAFSDCYKLTDITIQDSITNIGEWVFSGCSGLANKDGLVIVNNILFNICDDNKKVVIPEGVTRIWRGAFKYASELESITIPDSLMSIGPNAFEGCKGLKQILISNKEKKYLSEIKDSLPYAFSIIDFTIEEYASLFLNQKKKWQDHISRLIFKNSEFADEFVSCIVEKVEKMPEKEQKKNAKTLFGLLTLLTSAFSEESKKLLSNEIVKVDSEFAHQNGLEDNDKNSETKVENDEVLEYALQNKPQLLEYESALLSVSGIIHYSDSNTIVPKLVIDAFLTQYLIIWEKSKCEVAGEYGKRFDYTASSVNSFEFSKVADTIAAKLNRDELSRFLLTLVNSASYRYWLLAFMRNATEADMVTFLDSLRSKSAKERIKKRNVSYAVCMSDLRCAALFAKENGTLNLYAKFRGTDVDTICRTVILDSDLDANGKK